MGYSRTSNNYRPRRGGGPKRLARSPVGLTKAASQEMHALRAAKKRYGVDIGLLGMCEVRDQIQDGRSRLLERQSNRVTIHGVAWRGQPMVVAYDSLRHTLVTFLPLDFEPGVRPWR
ncbi:unnamed protein product [marine sediment metagenome]|uniref:Uncharacterized protein n=1 Tax=marine sediment metagenome TaxID=412755 RepID=X0RI87_9ZZZZ